MPQNMPLTDKITQESVPSSSVNTMMSELGNNIRQYADNGLNARRDRWAIQYAVLTEAEMKTVLAMLIAVGGGKDYINWTPDGETVSKKWIVINGEYTNPPISGSTHTVSFTIEQEH